MRGADLVGGHDRAGDRVVVAAALDGAALPRIPEQVPVSVDDGAAGPRSPPTLVRLHRPLGLLNVPEAVGELQGED